MLTLLARISGAKNAIEIGTFTGYSGLSIARGLPEDGSLLCCDSSEEYTAIAQKYFDRAGLADRVEIRIAPALETLHALPATEQFDLAFVDGPGLQCSIDIPASADQLVIAVGRLESVASLARAVPVFRWVKDGDLGQLLVSPAKPLAETTLP